MRLSRIRAELHSQRYGIAIGALALLVALGAPAHAVQGVSTAANSATKALKLAKKADKRSKQALRLAKKTGAQGPGGSQGLQGRDGDRGPSFGDGRQVPNMNNIPCGEDVVVGSQTLTLSEPSRIWVHGHGNLRVGGSTAADYGLWLQLRNAGNTDTLAVSTRAWGEQSAADGDLALSSGGLMLSGNDPDDSTPAFVAPAGTYILQLAVIAGNLPCVGSLPDFGFNQGSSMGYVLLGTG